MGFLEIHKRDIFFGEAMNIGMNSEISISDLAHEILKIMGVNLPVVREEKRVRPENSEVDRLVCNNQKLINGSSWKPQYDLKQGLLETINWFNENGHSKKGNLYAI